MTEAVPLPSAQTTLAILLGASAWPYAPDFERSAAFANSAQGLAAYLLAPNLFNLPAPNLLDLFDSELSPDDIDIEMGQFLDKRLAGGGGTGPAPTDLIVYFTGHGGFAGGGSSYYLAIRRTRRENRITSSIPILSLAHTLREKARLLRRVVVLDSCFAGTAFSVFQGQGAAHAAIAQAISAFNVHSTRAGFPSKGTSLLCSSGSQAPSLARPGERYTAFSGAMLHVLRSGAPDRQDNLSLYTLRDMIEDFLRSAYGDEVPRPEVHSPDQSEGDVAAVPLFPRQSMT
jgi:Caspase domain